MFRHLKDKKRFFDCMEKFGLEYEKKDWPKEEFEFTPTDIFCEKNILDTDAGIYSVRVFVSGYPYIYEVEEFISSPWISKKNIDSFLDYEEMFKELASIYVENEFEICYDGGPIGSKYTKEYFEGIGISIYEK